MTFNEKAEKLRKTWRKVSDRMSMMHCYDRVKVWVDPKKKTDLLVWEKNQGKWEIVYHTHDADPFPQAIGDVSIIIAIRMVAIVPDLLEAMILRSLAITKGLSLATQKLENILERWPANGTQGQDREDA